MADVELDTSVKNPFEHLIIILSLWPYVKKGGMFVLASYEIRSG